MKLRAMALVLALVCAIGLMPLKAQARSNRDQVLQIKNRDAAPTYYYYNEEGQLLREMNEASMDVTDYVYRSDGMLQTKLAHRDGRLLHRWNYDRNGDLSYEEEWNLSGDMIRYTQGQHTYDDFGRILESVYAIWSRDDQTQSEVHRYVYHDEADPDSYLYCLQKTRYRVEEGEMTYISDDITFYDEKGNVLGSHRSDENGSFSASYTYDSRGNVETYEYYRYRDDYTESMKVSYANRYNYRNQLVATRITYTKTVQQGAATEEITTEEVWKEEYRYDLLGRRIRLIRSSTDGTVTVDRRWKYDRWGNLLELTENGHLVEENQYGALKDALLDTEE